ncbi:MAG: VOC family protein [Verrucomicrobiota bacterium]
MKITHLFATLSLTAALTFSNAAHVAAQDSDKVFSKSTIDIGITVANVEKSAAFYADVLGLKEVKGFDVSADKATRLGLTDHQPANIRVFVLDDSKGATTARIKLMAFPKAPGVKPDQKFIHSTISISYLTLFVADLDLAVERVKKANVKLLGETPVDLGGGKFLATVQDPDGNFIELIGPSKK